MNKKSRLPFDRDILYNSDAQRIFRDSDLSEIAFPIGGIGTGTISLGGRGNLRDFEIFGHPDKGNVIPYTLFALWAKREGHEPIAKILEGKIPPPYRNPFGEPQTQLHGISRFEDAEFQAEYPMATVTLSDDDVPVSASVVAWNPFIPLNVMDSAIPGAIFEWAFMNDTDDAVDVSLCASTSNPLTHKDESGKYVNDGSVNSYNSDGDLKGIVMNHPDIDKGDPAAGTIALTTTWDNPDVQTRWFRGGGWWDKCHIFWDVFSATGRLLPVLDSEPAPGAGDVCSLVMHARIEPHSSVIIPVFYTWHFPKIANPWYDGIHEVLDTYVSTTFADAWDVACYLANNVGRLREETTNWMSAIFDSSLPNYVLEAVTSQASIMRTPTCMLLADGRFYGWEGCGDNEGCCFGNCTHVWNYEQSVAFLFPQLERTMRQTEFLYNTRPTGNMAFRTYLPPGSKLLEFKPCADGQMGVIMQAYRDWKISGDDDFLREIWPNMKLALEYAWSMTPEKMAPATPETGYRSIDSIWDPDKDGVIEGEQHNTYDIEFFGPNILCTAMYLGALKACEEIARYFGEDEKADEYHSIYESGRLKVDVELWNGEYYIQEIKVIDEVSIPEGLISPETQECGETCQCKQSPGGKASALNRGALPKYQYGDGCLSDQLLAQTNAVIFGLGYLLDPNHVRKAIKAVFDNNFCYPIGNFNNVQRVYALNEEAGLLVCSWPHGNRPIIPFVYSDEVWTGIEYHVAALLIHEGFVDEGLTLVKAVTERYSGYNRNPWDEIECGHHYARAMSSWGVKLALDGFTYDMIKKSIGFAPKMNANDYRTFWSTGMAWGEYSQNIDEGEFSLSVIDGIQKLSTIKLADLPEGEISVMHNGKEVEFKRSGDEVEFEKPLSIKPKDSFVIRAK